MASTTTTLTAEMMQYLSNDFLKKSLQLNPHRVGFKLKDHTKNSGKTVTWVRQDVPPVTGATTPVTETVTPTAIDFNDNTVSATLAVYGRHTVVSDLFNWTSIDEASNEKKDSMATQAANVADTLAREVMFTGSTVQFANGRSTLANLAAGDVMNSVETRKAVRTLKKNNATPFDDGNFIGKIGPDTAYDLMGDSVWVNAHTYKDGSNLYQGEVGRLFQVRFVECSSNQKSESSTVTVYSNFIHGKEAFGALKLEGAPAPKTGGENSRGGQNMQLIIKQDTGNNDTSNPLSLFFTIGWKFVDALATLNSSWAVNVKSSASA